MSTALDNLDARTAVLAQSQLCDGLGRDDIQRVAAGTRAARYLPGESICRMGEPGDCMFVVGSGCLRVTIPGRDGQERVLGYFERGDHFGEMAILGGGTRSTTVTAVQESELLVIDQQAFHKLFDELPRMAKNLLQTMGLRHRQSLLGQIRGPAARTVLLVRATPRAERLVSLLADAIARHGEQVALLTDGQAMAAGTHEILPLWPPSGISGTAADLAERLERLRRSHRRVLISVSPDQLARRPDLAASCDQILWLVEPKHEAACRAAYADVRASSPGAAAKLHVVWVLPEGTPVAPRWHTAWDSDNPSFKVEVSDQPGALARRPRQGLDRLVHHVRGIRIGLALGGGGARGMAHLGVLRAMDRAGITFDLMAGTSAGAMVGIGYAAGYDVEFAVEHWGRHLAPPRWLRKLPGGARWYLRWLLRSGTCDHRLRAYFHDWTLEQLQTPFSAVTADLMTGNQVVRALGDAIHAILESGNLPVVSVPILRDGMALVDGGILNNLPADVLTAKGASFVVGVNVTSRMAPRFAGNRAGTPSAQMRRPGFMETLARVYETLLHELNAIHARGVDLLIEPQTAGFGFAEFHRSAELAEVGEAAAEAALPQLKAMLAELDSGKVHHGDTEGTEK